MTLPKTISKCSAELHDLRLVGLRLRRKGAAEKDMRAHSKKMESLVNHRQRLVDIQKNHSVSVRFTGPQFVELKKHAKSRNEGISEFIRNQLIAHRVI